MTTKTRRRYTDECKAEAIRLVRDSARPVAQVARDLGIADRFLIWCTERGIALRYIQPAQNGFIERFNRTYRTEVLNA